MFDLLFLVTKIDQMTLALKFIQFYKYCRKKSLVDYIAAQLSCCVVINEKA